MTKFNLKFLKNIITSDFLIVNPVFLKQKTAPLKIKTHFAKAEIQGNLDVLTLNRSLKQFVRTLQFLNKKPGTFSIYTKKIVYSNILLRFLADLVSKKRVSINNIITTSASVSYYRRKVDIAVLFDYCFAVGANLKKFQNNNCYLVNSINLLQNYNNFGFYKIFNDLISLKKRLFLTIILRNTLKFYKKKHAKRGLIICPSKKQTTLKVLKKKKLKKKTI